MGDERRDHGPSGAAALAPEIDRLVWAVRDTVRLQHDRLPASSELSRSTFYPLINLMSFVDELSESFIRRRYVYRQEGALVEFLDELESGGYLTRDGDRLAPTHRLAPIGEEVGDAIAAVARHYWADQPEDVNTASSMVRTVMDAGPGRDGLFEVAQRAPEADDMYRRFWQRLSALRLLRNEAHVAAWRAAGLGPRDIEALTDAWAGTKVQADVIYGDALIERGYVRDGSVTEAGLAARTNIEDATNQGVASAFAAIDASALLDILSGLPPERWDEIDYEYAPGPGRATRPRRP